MFSSILGDGKKGSMIVLASLKDIDKVIWIIFVPCVLGKQWIRVFKGSSKYSIVCTAGLIDRNDDSRTNFIQKLVFKVEVLKGRHVAMTQVNKFLNAPYSPENSAKAPKVLKFTAKVLYWRTYLWSKSTTTFCEKICMDQEVLKFLHTERPCFIIS